MALTAADLAHLARKAEMDNLGSLTDVATGGVQEAERAAQLAALAQGKAIETLNKPAEDKGGMWSWLEPISGPVGKLMELANRPYSAVVSIPASIGAGQNPLPAMGKALSGARMYGVGDIMTQMGIPWQGSGLGRGVALMLDMANPIDPLNYLTLGTNKLGKPMRMLAKGATKAELAKKGGWGVINIAGRTITPQAVNVPVAEALTATGARIAASPTYQGVRSMVGGKTYLMKQKAPELLQRIKEAATDYRMRMSKVGEQMSTAQHVYPMQARRTATYATEDPRFLQGKPFVVQSAGVPTPESVQAHYEALSERARIAGEAAVAHRGRFMNELEQVRAAVDNINDRPDEFETVQADQLWAYAMDRQGTTSEEDMLAEIFSSGDPRALNAILTDMMKAEGRLPSDPNYMVEIAGIFANTEWNDLVQKYGGPRRKVVGPKYKKIYEWYDDPKTGKRKKRLKGRELVMRTERTMTKKVKKFEELPVVDAQGNPVLDKNGLPTTKRVMTGWEEVPDPSLGAPGPVMQTRYVGGRLYGEAQRIWRRRLANSEFALGTEFAPVTQNRGGMVILVKKPAFSNLIEGLEDIGGRRGTDIAARKGRVNTVLDALSQWAAAGGDTMRLTEALVSGDVEAYSRLLRDVKLPEGAERKIRSLSSKDKTVQKILRAVHAQIWHGASNPGRYSRNLQDLSEAYLESIGDVVKDFTNPAERAAYMTQKFNEERAKILDELDALDRGEVRTPDDTPQDPFNAQPGGPGAVEDEVDDIFGPASQQSPRVAREQSEATRQSLERINNEMDAIEAEMQTTTDPQRLEVLQKRFDYLSEQWSAAFDGSPADVASEFLTSPTGPTGRPEGFAGAQPAQFVQDARRTRLLERLAVVNEMLANPDPFDQAYQYRKLLGDRVIPGVQYNSTLSKIDPSVDVTPEVDRLMSEGEAILNDTADRFYERIKESMTPEERAKFVPPIENYLPHEKPRGSWIKRAYDRLTGLESADIAEYRKQRNVYYANQGWRDAQAIQQQVDREIADLWGPKNARSGATLKPEDVVHFQARKYRNTIYEINRSDLPQVFDEDYAYLVNRTAAIRESWIYGYDITKFAKERYGKAFADLTPEELKTWKPLSFPVPFLPQGRSPFKDFYVPGEIYDMMNAQMRRVGYLYTDPGMRAFMHGVHQFRRWFSAWTLGIFPAYHVRNLFGDQMRAAMEGLSVIGDAGIPTRESVADYFAAQQFAQRMLWGSTMYPKGKWWPERLRGKTVLDKSQPVKDLLAEIKAAMPGLDMTEEKLLRLMDQEGIISQTWLRDIDENPAVQAAIASADRSRIAKAMDWVPLVGIQRSKLLAKGGAIGSAINSYTRTALFVHRLRKNLRVPAASWEAAFEDAVEAVRRSQFDYSDLTPFEQNFMKLTMPFYTYTAKNLPYMLQKMVSEPRRFAWQARAYSSSRAAFQDEMSEADVPQFLAKGMGMPLGKSTDKNGDAVYHIFTPKGWFPVADVNEFGEALRNLISFHPEEAAKVIAGMTNPMVKESIEQAMLKDSFTGQEIDTNQTRDIMGFNVPPRVAHVLRNIRLISEIDRLNPGGLWTKIGEARGQWYGQRPHRMETTEGRRWLRATTGLTFYDLDIKDSLTKEAHMQLQEASKAKYDMRKAFANQNFAEVQKQAIRLKKASSRATDLKARLDAIAQGRAAKQATAPAARPGGG